MAGEARYLGVGVEPAYGTLAAAQKYFDFIRADLDVPEDPTLYYPGAGGKVDGITMAGPYIPRGTVEVGVDDVFIGYLLRGAFGSYGVAGSGTYTHTFKQSNALTLPSLSLRLGKGVFEHQVVGASVARLGLTLERGFLVGSFECLGQKDIKAAIDASAKTFPSAYYAWREAAATLGGGAVTTTVEQFSLQLDNRINADEGVNWGSRFPTELPVEGIEVQGTMRLKFSSTTEYERFWGGATGPAVGGGSAADITVTLTKGSATLTLNIPSGQWRRVTTPVQGRDRVTQTVAFKGLYNSGQDTALKLTIVNTFATYAAA